MLRGPIPRRTAHSSGRISSRPEALPVERVRVVAVALAEVTLGVLHEAQHGVRFDLDHVSLVHGLGGDPVSQVRDATEDHPLYVG
jgi:hypothetical protein